MRKQDICRGCTSPILSGETGYYSGVYGAADTDILCEGCEKHEDALIAEKGTNDIPELRDRYAANATKL